MTGSADVVLEWCSVIGNGSRAAFERATAGLGIDEPARLLGGLELAGHIEVDWERTGRWSVNPPSLALPAGSGGNAALIGARNGGTRARIDELISHGIVDSFNAVAGSAHHASTWFVGCASLDKLSDAAVALGANVAVHPGPLLMDLFSDLDQALASSESEFTPSGFQARRLNVETLRFEPVDVKYARWPAGCFAQLSMGRQKYIYVDGDDRRYVCDRWIATHAEIRRQRRQGRSVPEVLWWDGRTRRMAVVSSAQLPTPWARAAILCSGLAPRRVETDPWRDVYEGVPATMYRRFAEALELAKESTDLGHLDPEDQ